MIETPIVFDDPFSGKMAIFMSDVKNMNEIKQKNNEEFTFATGYSNGTTSTKCTLIAKCVLTINMRYDNTYYFNGTMVEFMDEVRKNAVIYRDGWLVGVKT